MDAGRCLIVRFLQCHAHLNACIHIIDDGMVASLIEYSLMSGMIWSTRMSVMGEQRQWCLNLYHRRWWDLVGAAAEETSDFEVAEP
ncbi:hypothetical protein E6O75_ATG03608 [Venturia nashicola]|uniref:Uncharacterized protein n=1 Tax=Venturia nashicola TaxID=86259 RepID=A0A4Z1PAT2_9PEZI|nr:hypothetical protein E6O75_ATG03608 [Venturia nashicola]